ncbi:hypothetical protein AGMMS49579_26780 [Spirochaetia bacterium]|nr:hypothetical protein AGMMS49579_26780 [Spirochaetia bacterium]
MKKRFLFVAAMAALALCAETAFAQTEAEFNVTLTDDGSGVVITGYTGKAVQVRIPAIIQGMPVKEIGDSAFDMRDRYGGVRDEMVYITSITLPTGLEKIGSRAFYGQSKLSAVVIPDSVVEIGDEAFRDCYFDYFATGLSSVTLPKSLAKAGKSIFAGCRLLKTVTIPDGVKVIGASMFRDCTALVSVVIPDSVIEIGESAFSIGNIYDTNHPPSLVSVTLGKGITSLPERIFEKCIKLKTITIPEGVTEIGNYAFNGCTALESVVFPSTIVEIGELAFENCSALTTVSIPDSVTAIKYGRVSFRGCSKLNLASQAALKKRSYTESF